MCLYGLVFVSGAETACKKSKMAPFTAKIARSVYCRTVSFPRGLLLSKYGKRSSFPRSRPSISTSTDPSAQKKSPLRSNMRDSQRTASWKYKLWCFTSGILGHWSNSQSFACPSSSNVTSYLNYRSPYSQQTLSQLSPQCFPLSVWIDQSRWKLASWKWGSALCYQAWCPYEPSASYASTPSSSTVDLSWGYFLAHSHTSTSRIQCNCQRWECQNQSMTAA